MVFSRKKLLLVFLFLLLTGLVLSRFSSLGDKKREIKVADKIVKVEIADTDQERERGLSDRKSLCSDCGMLFVFGQPGIYPFWMKKMYFDSDIIWILGDRVVDITHNAKKPSLKDFDSPQEIYTPKVAVNKVLEVNAGWSKENNIGIGDAVVSP